jgi:hypothetical protein
MNSLVFATTQELATSIRQRRVSATEVLEAYLAQIARYNPTLNAIVTIDEERQAGGEDDAAFLSPLFLSPHRFLTIEVRPWLSLIAYNLGDLWRRLALPTPIGKWSLTSL